MDDYTTGPEDQTVSGMDDVERMKQAQAFVDEHLGNAAAILREVSEEIKEEWAAIRRGDEDAKTLSKLTRSDLLGLTRLLLETEEKLNGQTSGRAGRAGAYAIDFAQARSTIGGRLAKLRTARQAESVSGGSERQ